jgi:hypothetical protein
MPRSYPLWPIRPCPVPILPCHFRSLFRSVPTPTEVDHPSPSLIMPRPTSYCIAEGTLFHQPSSWKNFLQLASLATYPFPSVASIWVLPQFGVASMCCLFSTVPPFHLFLENYLQLASLATYPFRVSPHFGVASCSCRLFQLSTSPPLPKNSPARFARGPSFPSVALSSCRLNLVSPLFNCPTFPPLPNFSTARFARGPSFPSVASIWVLPQFGAASFQLSHLPASA